MKDPHKEFLEDLKKEIQKNLQKEPLEAFQKEDKNELHEVCLENTQ